MWLRSRGDMAVLRVTNTGPPVPPEQVDRLFEPFQRLHRTADDDHHGLGLSIVRAIAPPTAGRSARSPGARAACSSRSRSPAGRGRARGDQAQNAYAMADQSRVVPSFTRPRTTAVVSVA